VDTGPASFATGGAPRLPRTGNGDGTRVSGLSREGLACGAGVVTPADRRAPGTRFTGAGLAAGFDARGFLAVRPVGDTVGAASAAVVRVRRGSAVLRDAGAFSATASWCFAGFAARLDVSASAVLLVGDFGARLDFAASAIFGDRFWRVALRRLFAAGGSATAGARFAADFDAGTFGAAVGSARARDRFGAVCRDAGACATPVVS
jgi:hypothetical protein